MNSPTANSPRPEAPHGTGAAEARLRSEEPTSVPDLYRISEIFHTLQGERTPTIWQVFFGPGIEQDFSRAKRDAFDTVNARLALSNENWTFTVWGRNLYL